MFTSTSNAGRTKTGAPEVLIPLIRAAATIGFAIAPCSLGFVIIAVSEQVIRSILVGEVPEMLVSDLQNQFPNAALEVIEGGEEGLMERVVDLIDGNGSEVNLTLDIHGTDFQSRVWDELRKVPAGATLNYTFLAEQSGASLTGGFLTPSLHESGKHYESSLEEHGDCRIAGHRRRGG
jgi:hypothetical protein